MKKTNKNTKTAVKKSVKKSATKAKTSVTATKKSTAKKTTAKATVKKPVRKSTAKKADAIKSTACAAAKVETPKSESIGNVMARGMRRYASKFASIATIVIMAASVLMTGCKSIPTVEKMTTTARSVGVAAAAVCNVSGLDSESKAAIINIMDCVDDIVPTNSQKFVDAWMPIVKVEVKKLVDAGKIDDGKGTIIIAAVNVACKGVDYIFDVKYPKAREYEELVSAAVHGFDDGFLATINPNMKLSASAAIKMDEDAYKYLKSAK